MFLNFLTEDIEKIFFLKFAYLLAVAEKENNSENIPIWACRDNPEKGEYEFEGFTPGFSMQTRELIMLRKFAEEMEMKWDPISSYSSASSSGSATSCSSVVRMLSSCHSSKIFGGAVACSQMIKSPDSFEKIASKNSVATLLKVITEESKNTTDRSGILKLALATIFAQANVESFAVEKRKAILMEATAMAYADGNVSAYEQELLISFCELCHLDEELIEEFKDITKEFSRLYSKGLELITE